MRDFVIISDGGGDLTKVQREQFRIEKPFACTVVWPNGEEKINDVDWGNITPNEYFALMSEKNNVFKTSMPNIQTVYEKFIEYAKDNKDIMVVTLSHGLSGAYNVISSIAQQVMEENPDVTIKVVDSLRYGGAIALIEIYASIYRQNGDDINQAFEKIEKLKLTIHESGIMDDLFFLFRSGRISKVTAFMGTMVGVKPMADFNNETGQSQVIGKARGYKKFFKVFPEYIKQTIGNPEGKVFVITHSFRDEQAKQMEEIVKDVFDPEYLLFVPLGQVNGANIGPGLCATFYCGDEPVSENCVNETKIIESLLNK